MTVRVKVNGEMTEVEEHASVRDVVVRALEAARSPSDGGTAVAVNSDVVPRGSWATTRVAAGDRIEILTATQGG